MKKTTNILMVGVGGQGIILASGILSLAAMYAGYDTKKSEIHGMSQRGGSVFSHIRFGEKIWSPVISRGEAEILVALEELETLRWISYANPQTFVLVMKTRINPAMVEEYPGGITGELSRLCSNLLFVEPQPLVEKTGSPKYLNVALLGIIAGRIGLDEAAWQQAIEEKVPAGTFAENWQAFLQGKKIYREEVK